MIKSPPNVIASNETGWCISTIEFMHIKEADAYLQKESH